MSSLGGRTYNKTSPVRNSPEGPKALLGKLLRGLVWNDGNSAGKKNQAFTSKRHARKAEAR
jgi:hypothetical protein